MSKIPLTTEEQNLFELLGKGENGRIMEAYFLKLIQGLADIRNIEKGLDNNLEILARERAIKILEENVMERLKGFNNKKPLNVGSDQFN